VAVNDQAVLSNFDIYASAGGQNKAVQQSFNVTSDAAGAITVSFSEAAGSAYPAAVTAIAAGPGPTNGALPNGTYTVTNSSSGLVWDDPGSSKQQGTDVIVYAATGNPNQSWTFTALGNGYYKIVNAYSGLALNDPASSLSAGTLLIQYPFQNTSNEYWLLTPSGNGYVITSKVSGLAVDPNANSSGSDIRQESANGTSSQVWIVH
jgi:endo-1,4-beta-xylanase